MIIFNEGAAHIHVWGIRYEFDGHDYWWNIEVASSSKKHMERVANNASIAHWDGAPEPDAIWLECHDCGETHYIKE